MLIYRLGLFRYSRGQVFPLWVAAILVCLAFAFLSINYGNQIRWQIRAQNAADAAAIATTSIQAQRFNEIEIMLYTINVEEFRADSLFSALTYAINQGGGCTIDQTNWASVAFGTCGYVYAKLRDPFIRSATRYTNDVNVLQQVSSESTYTNWLADSRSLLTHLQSKCNMAGAATAVYHPDGGDCGFKYSIAPGGSGTRVGLLAVQDDALAIQVPSLGHVNTVVGSDTEAPNLWAPAEIDIVTCKLVPPIISGFGPFKFQSTYAVGRAAATPVMAEQDWLQPGAINDPIRVGDGDFSYFQPLEDYVDQPTEGHDYIQNCPSVNTTSCITAYSASMPSVYNVDYGGNDAVAYSTYDLFSAPVNNPEMSVRMGWWSTIAIQPFGSAPTLNTTTCN